MVDDDGLIRFLMAIEKGFLLGNEGSARCKDRVVGSTALTYYAQAGNREETGSKTDVSDDIFN